MKIEDLKLSLYKLRELSASDIGHMLRHPKMGERVKEAVNTLPNVEITASIQPITRTVLRVTFVIEHCFTWNSKVHGSSESFWIWVEDANNEHLYHSELFVLQAEKCRARNRDDRMHSVTFTIPIFEPLPPQYYIRAISDRWLGCESVVPMSFQHLILPQQYPPFTKLLNLQPLPKEALQNPKLEAIYRFSHFNPVQTQIFHVLYHSDKNVLVGAPTGSGKTVAAELALYRMFRDQPMTTAVYIAPLKALVRERLSDWTKRLVGLGKRIIELTGDVTPDAKAIARADVIITTPEKWDGISRSWQTRKFVKNVALLIIDEIHLLGADRGPIYWRSSFRVRTTLARIPTVRCAYWVSPPH